MEVSIIIPNFNGLGYLKECFDSLRKQTQSNFEVILVDKGSEDDSISFTRIHYPEVKIISLKENSGFCRAVNEGILYSKAPYVILLNNDTAAEENFVEELLKAVKRHPRAFSCGAKMLQYHDPSKIDDAGNYYCALGWAFARGKGRRASAYEREEKVFAVCAGAAIYRRDIFESIGLFDEEHFAYLEDTDIGYRARIAGYENWFAPRARVRHIGSGTSGSRYNQFKIRYSSRNNVYMIYKNMPFLQWVINLPLLIAGFGVKFLFFASKGFGREYLAGIKNGLSLCRKERKYKFRMRNLGRYVRLQIELWINIIRRIREFQAENS